ncbi:cation transport regulator [Pyrrhoderma noxium]|uniref:glutathione-specific gamma-glutamylcyclotransferase n=1 Tax=Pyrrhoderma noxium TaxID=2282107 RepID=A0A286UQ25_9AGAM|nr:cation transport regulator [Pyrrhoderma noxium]
MENNNHSTPSKAPYIVFGYGSLIWKPPPHTIKHTPGYLKGYVRRFAQKSHDHRGTPESPGRVVTLIHKEDWDRYSASDAFPEEDTVWGIAYTIDPAHDEVVRQYLDHREKDGYTVELVDIHSVHDGQEQVVISGTYVGKPENPSFIGSQTIEELAQCIVKSVGPSGENKVYLYELAEAVRKLAPESYDSHLFALEKRVKELEAEIHRSP